MAIKILDTRQMGRATMGGTERTFYRVWIETSTGAQGHVDIPASDWEPEKIARALEDKASDLDLAYAVAEALNER